MGNLRQQGLCQILIGGDSFWLVSAAAHKADHATELLSFHYTLVFAGSKKAEGLANGLVTIQRHS